MSADKTLTGKSSRFKAYLEAWNRLFHSLPFAWGCAFGSLVYAFSVERMLLLTHVLPPAANVAQANTGESPCVRAAREAAKERAQAAKLKALSAPLKPIAEPTALEPTPLVQSPAK